MPPLPKQLHRQGQLSLSDRDTWVIKLTDGEKEQIMTRQEAIASFGEEAVVRKKPESLEIKLQGSPKQPLTPEEALWALQKFSGVTL